MAKRRVMSSTNGHSPTVQDFNGIKIDLNRTTRRNWITRLNDILKEEDLLKAGEMTGVLVETVVVEWPFDVPISKDGFLDLPFGDSRLVESALQEAQKPIAEKK